MNLGIDIAHIMGRNRSNKVISRTTIGILVGLLLGLFVGLWSQSVMLPCSSGATGICCGSLGSLSVDRHLSNSLNQEENIAAHLRTSHSSNSLKKMDSSLVFVGVMTAKKYLDSRVRAVYETWAKSIHGKVVFFSSEGSVAPRVDDPNDKVPLVALPGVDDSYPPQKKSFLMLKYMHDRYGDKYQWFMRADDDVYIKGDKLANFLHSLNSSKPLFLGQAGLGNKAEFGQLSLNKTENYCMGGTGMVISQAALALMVPHTSYCLQNLYTTHEDVEIGRCISRFAGVSCSWAFEVSKY